MEPSDETLILACRQGDSAAWEALVTRYQRLVFSIPRRIGLETDFASEVFQQVFTILFERLDTIEQPQAISAWLATTARRESYRILRREQAFQAQRDDDSEANETWRDPALLPDEHLVRMEEQHRIRTALATLEPRCKTLLTLLFYCDKPPSYAEIATAIGTSEGSIGPTRARCLQKLARALQHAEQL